MLFDESGDRKGLTQIEQFQHGAEVRVAVYDPSKNTKNKITWEKEIIWIGIKDLLSLNRIS